jgi:hypothetical protein
MNVEARMLGMMDVHTDCWSSELSWARRACVL